MNMYLLRYTLFLFIYIAAISCEASKVKDTGELNSTSSTSVDSNTKRDNADSVHNVVSVQNESVEQKGTVNANTKEWLLKTKEIADWYASNFSDYQQFLNGKMCPLIDKKVRDDCSGLVTACLVNYGVYDGNNIFNSANFRDKNSSIGILMKKKFKPIEGNFMQTEYESFKPGDILAGYMFEDGKVQRNHGHVTIYAGNGKFYDWGGWAYKSKTQPVAGEEAAGYMHDHLYTIIWRMK